MKITIEPTGRFETVNGIECRLWKGITDKGIEVLFYSPMVRVHRDADNSEFERELREVQAERQLVSFDHRML